MNDEIRKILVVEDDPGDMELTLRALGELDLAPQVVVAHNGEEALDYLYCRKHYVSRSHENPAAVLLDLKLPRVSGQEVLRRMKADPDLKSIPVIVLTSSRAERDLMDCYSLGVNAFVIKSPEFPDFIRSIKQLAAFWGETNEPPPESHGPADTREYQGSNLSTAWAPGTVRAFGHCAAS